MTCHTTHSQDISPSLQTFPRHPNPSLAGYSPTGLELAQAITEVSSHSCHSINSENSSSSSSFNQTWQMNARSESFSFAFGARRSRSRVREFCANFVVFLSSIVHMCGHKVDKMKKKKKEEENIEDGIGEVPWFVALGKIQETQIELSEQNMKEEQGRACEARKKMFRRGKTWKLVKKYLAKRFQQAGGERKKAFRG